MGRYSVVHNEAMQLHEWTESACLNCTAKKCESCTVAHARNLADTIQNMILTEQGGSQKTGDYYLKDEAVRWVASKAARFLRWMTRSMAHGALRTAYAAEGIGLSADWLKLWAADALQSTLPTAYGGRPAIQG